jgi:hypothetical protein
MYFLESIESTVTDCGRLIIVIHRLAFLLIKQVRRTGFRGGCRVQRESVDLVIVSEGLPHGGGIILSHRLNVRGAGSSYVDRFDCGLCVLGRRGQEAPLIHVDCCFGAIPNLFSVREYCGLTALSFTITIVSTLRRSSISLIGNATQPDDDCLLAGSLHAPRERLTILPWIGMFV